MQMMQIIFSLPYLCHKDFTKWSATEMSDKGGRWRGKNRRVERVLRRGNEGAKDLGLGFTENERGREDGGTILG